MARAGIHCPDGRRAMPPVHRFAPDDRLNAGHNASSSESPMPNILGIDHIAITATDLEATCAFFDKLFGARTHLEYAPEGKPLVRQIALGGALLSVHQAGNGLTLVARQPTIGAGDICLRWAGDIASAIALLREHDIALTEGPARRRTADGLSSLSIYFRDPDGNLIELMAAD